MTTPAPTPPSLPPQCLLYVDGARYADGSPGHDTDPVALDHLVVTWGRDTILDQPSPATCSFRVLDLAGGQSFRPVLAVGARVDVLASTTIYGAPTLSSFADPGFETGGFGGTVDGGTAATVTAPTRTGSRALRVLPDAGAAAVLVLLPPRPFSPDPIAWDTVPRAKAGQTWQLTAWVLLPHHLDPSSQAVYVQAVAFTHPDGRTPTALLPRVPVTGDPGVWQHVTIPNVVAPVDSWLGVRVTCQPVGPAWDTLTPAITWDTLTPAALTWDEIGAVYLDDVDVLAPPAGALRQGAVFSGRVTDLNAQYDLTLGGTLVTVTCQDDTAELANRYVGAAPWPAQTVAARVAAVLAAAGQPRLTATVDPGVAARALAYLDVDASPAAGLLQTVAQSVGGALWVTTSVAGNATLRVEDVDARPPLQRLALVGGVVVIVVAPVIGAAGIDLDACLLLLEPVHWQQDSNDAATQVAVTWREQTAAGPPPTLVGRTETVTDDALTATRGRFRVGVSTELAGQADAQLLANTLLARLSVGGWRVDGLTWHLDAADLLDGAALTRVMQVLDGTTRVGLPILLTNLPGWSLVTAGDSLPLYLEGGRFTNDRGAWTLELQTSSAISQGAAAVCWDELDPTWTWDQFDPAISWDDLAGVGL